MLKKLIKPKLKTFAVKITPAQEELFRKRAKQYTNGNISEWLRYAAENHEPKKGDLV